MRFVLSILFFIFFSCNHSNKQVPTAVKGILDLKNWNFLEDGNVPLNGEWNFFWEESLNLEEIEDKKKCSTIEFQNCENPQTISVPRPWNNFLYKKKSSDGMIKSIILPVTGYATYHLKILTSEEGIFAIKVPFIGNEFELFINNKLILKNGNFSTHPKDSSPKRKTYIINFLKDSQELDIVIRISNYNYSRGGIFGNLDFGRTEKMSEENTFTIASAFSLFGIFFIMGIYHLVLSLERKNNSTVYFGILCTILSLYHLFSDESDNLGYDLIPFIDYNFGISLEYILVYNIFLLFFLFVSEIFPFPEIKKWKWIYIIFILICSIFTISTSALTLTNIFYYTQYILIFILITIIYISYRAIKRNIQGGKVFLLGFGILFVLVINDILHRMSLVDTRYMSAYGLVFFIFSQAYLLTLRFSQAFRDVESLSNTLQLSNKELELTKERATKAYLDLEASQKQLVQSDKMITLGMMVAGVAHEINTPLGAIKANAENIQESLRSLIQKLNPKLNSFTEKDLSNTFKVLELVKDSPSNLSSRDYRSLRKKIISILESRGHKNVEFMGDYILELNLTEALEKEDEIFLFPEIEKYLGITADLYGIRKKAGVIQISSERVSKIVKSLKSFMHFEEREERVLADLTEGMETVLIILHNKIKYGIEVIKNYGSIPQIHCYPDELNQVWTNLIHNAVQAMDEKGKLQIDIEKVGSFNGTPDIDKRNSNFQGDYISIAIQDSGSGIPPEIRAKIFQAFFTTKPAGEGSGLGLHIIGKILEKHEGALHLESQPGKTRFTVLLPLI